MNRVQRAGIAAAALVALSGCASIFNGQTQAVTIGSVPAGAEVTINNRAGQAVHTGVTPLTVQLRRGAGYFRSEAYSVAYKKDGYADASARIDSSVSGWYIGNIIFGGLIGMLGVDPATGGMYVFPEQTSTALVARTDAPFAAAGTRSPGAPSTSPRIGVYVGSAEQAASNLSCAKAPSARMVDSGPTFERFAMACDNGSAMVMRCTAGGCQRE